MTRTGDGIFSVLEAGIDQLSEALASGQTTSVELVAAYLNRIAAYDRRGPRLNSTPVLNPGCFAEAARSDKKRREHHDSEPLPALHGIPFTVKDSFKVSGLTVAAGSPAFADLIAQDDAFVVSALRSKGAIVLGKTNMPPMAIGGCQRGLYGRAESPYNPDFLPAAWHSGSSSGSGVAVSASLCAFGLGEETVSSGRSPASNGGLVAYTPSRGLISSRGNWPLFALRDTVVPHTRSMRDMIHVVDALMVEDSTPAGDLWKTQGFVELPSCASVKPKAFQDLATPGGLKGLRLGVPKMYVGNDADATDPIHVRPSIKGLFEEARATLTQLGVQCVDVDLPVVSAYEKDRPSALSLVDRGMLPEGWNQIEINDLVSASWEEFLRNNGAKECSSLNRIKPWVIHADPPEAVDTRRADVAHEGQDQILYDYIVERVRQKTAPHSPLDFPQLSQVCAGLERARRELFEQWQADEGLDGIVFPANADVAPSNADIDPGSSKIAWRNGTVFSNMNHVMRHLGIPSISVPMGIMDDTGMPVGLTFAGPAYTDTKLMRWAFDYESASPKRVAPASVPELDTRRASDAERATQPAAGEPPLNYMPALAIKISGDGTINTSGCVNLTIRVDMSMEPPPPSEQDLRLSVSIVVDGTKSFTFETENPSKHEVFPVSLEVPASERRGARHQSSLIVVTTNMYSKGPNEKATRINTEGAYANILYRYP